MYSCIIIDDEDHAIDGLKNYLDSAPNLRLVGMYSNSVDALKNILAAESVDIIFLDVDMPNINGLELAREIRSKTKKLVFTTGHTRYAYDAFELDADGFLLKPYSLAKFLALVHKLFPDNFLDEDTREEEAQFIFVKSKDEGKIVKVNLNEIVMIESKSNYIQLNSLDKNIVTYMSLTELAKKLNGKQDFIQVQRSFIINKNFIEYIEGNTLKMLSGAKVTLGEMYRKDFNDFVAERLFTMGKKK